ncbi:MAG: hypothetical protein KC560_07020 [Myxococcales bacterium]|nr:hypothetical protein [Myxococcales bacterium]
MQATGGLQTGLQDVFRTGYILGPRADAIWFLGLPFLAIAAALAADSWLPFAALAAINVWVTVPHHYATWVRTYAYRPDLERYRTRLVVAPLVLLGVVSLGLSFAPLALFWLIRLWDIQHGLMQQHGFARIYDFKAGTGSESTRRYDLGFHAVMYVNMMIATPLYTQTFWVPAVSSLGVDLSASDVAVVHAASWTAAGAYLVFYVAHVLRSVARGGRVNPLKYLFIGASYFLWYFTAYQTNSVLVWGVAHRLMHGVQYIVMVHAYMQRKHDTDGIEPAATSRMFDRGGLAYFLGAAVFYAAAYQVIVGGSLADFGFGFLSGGEPLGTRHQVPLLVELQILALPEVFQLLHFYVDSFIWKVSDKRVQQSL